MDGVCRLCIVSPPEFDVTTAALYTAWIAGKSPEQLQLIAREYYDKGPSSSNTNFTQIDLNDTEIRDEDISFDDFNNITSDSDRPVLVQHAGDKTPEKINTNNININVNINSGENITCESANYQRNQQSPAEIALKQQLVFRRKSNRYMDETVELIKSAVYDDIRTFEALEHYLHAPTLLRTQTMLQIRSTKTQSFVIEKYWSLDDVVVREVIVGSKRLTRSRKDLDDVSEYTGISLRSVTRQFDNIKRLYTQVEDLEECNLYDFMARNILLSPILCRKYACILFLLYSKFTLTSKKRIQRVKLRGLEKCAALTLACLVSDCNTFFRICQQGAGSVSDISGGGSFVHTGGTTSSSSAHVHRSVSSPAASTSLPLPIPPTATSTNAPLQRMHASSMASSAGSSSPPPFSATLATTDTQPSTPIGTEPSEDAVCETISKGDAATCWGLVWAVFPYVNAVDPDKQLMNNLRDMKSALTGDVLNMACQCVTSSLLERPGGPIIVKKLEGSRLRSMLKTIMQIGANLSQTREYRDFFEDILTKIAEPLEEAGLSLTDMNTFLVCCSHLAKAIPETHRVSNMPPPGPNNTNAQGSHKNDKFNRRKDCARFILCCRLVLLELVEGSL